MEDLATLLLKEQLFEELRVIVNGSPWTRDPGAFVDWLVDNYVTALGIGIRRITDLQNHSRSLGRILFEMLEHPRIMTRKAYRSLYRGSPLDPDPSFDRLAGRNRGFVAQQILRHDLRSLERAEERVRRYVNKRIAHMARPGAIRRMLTFGELHAALDLLDQTAVKYKRLLNGGAADTARPTRLYEWRKVLMKPWWPAEEPRPTVDEADDPAAGTP